MHALWEFYDDDDYEDKYIYFGMSYAHANNYFPLQQKLYSKVKIISLIIRIKFAMRANILLELHRNNNKGNINYK